LLSQSRSLRSESLDCDRVVFRSGADLFVAGAAVSLEDADFAAPSLIAPLILRGKPPSDSPARLVSMRRAKVAHLAVADLDLRACRFAGAHGLDGLRLERTRFVRPPTNTGLRWRWSTRQTVAEEHVWRHAAGHGPGWYDDDALKLPAWLADAVEPPAPDEIASTYRSLRKGREDAKNEPGAADFYYGEMEMRRQGGPRATHDPSDPPRAAPLGERWLLGLYWLVAGYGLRASRALIALALAITLAAIPLWLWGLRPDRSYGQAVLFAVQSSVSLLRAPQADLTTAGQVTEIVLRLAGPLFFGLALISVRGRVKR
jgi:hypothetical protein